MIDERELLRHSLPPKGARWAEFEAKFLGKKPVAHSPQTSSTRSGASSRDADRLHRHFDECDACKNWFSAYRAGYAEPRTRPSTTFPLGRS